MSTVVRLQVEAVDLDNESTLQRIGEHLADALWMKVDGLVTASVEANGTDVASDVIEFARRVEHHLPGSNVRRVHPDLVTVSDIAARTGFSREAVRKWVPHASGRNFPIPLGTVGGNDRPSKVWLWPDVAAWLISTYEFPIEKDWPEASVVAHIDACLARVPDYRTVQWHHAADVDEIVSRLQSLVAGGMTIHRRPAAAVVSLSDWRERSALRISSGDIEEDVEALVGIG